MEPRISIVTIATDNLDRAVRFYEREGFTRTGEGVNKHSGAATYLYEWKP